MADYRSIRIERGPGGFGGPLTVTPTGQKNKVMYITGGGAEPECLAKIVELTGMIPVNGFKTKCPEEEIALAIIDCGGTLRCGIYPKKGIPTVNVMPVGKAGPMAQYIVPEIYVSAVTSEQVSPAGGAVPAPNAEPARREEPRFTANQKVSETLAKQENKSLVTKIGLGAGKVVNTFYQAARDAIQTCITTLLPFMAFVSMLIGIINGSGFGDAFAQILTPLAGNIFGLVALGLICSCPPCWVPARSSPRSSAPWWARRSARAISPPSWPSPPCSPSTVRAPATSSPWAWAWPRRRPRPSRWAWCP